jgi:hypothetical protein
MDIGDNITRIPDVLYTHMVGIILKEVYESNHNVATWFNDLNDVNEKIRTVYSR